MSIGCNVHLEGLGRAIIRVTRRRRHAASFAGTLFMRPPGTRHTQRARWRSWSLLVAGLALLTLAPLLAYSQEISSSAVAGDGGLRRPPAYSRTTSLRESTVSPTASLRK